MLSSKRPGGGGAQRGISLSLAVLLLTISQVQASFSIEDVKLDGTKTLELSNEGGTVLAQTVQAYFSTLKYKLSDADFTSLTPTNVLSIDASQLPTTGQSKEFIIPNDFQVPQPGDVCGSYFLIFTLSEGQETVPYSQFPVSRTKECSEDVDLAWAMSGDANELSLSLASENNLQVLGSISGLSITNDGATDLAIRSAMDAPEVFAFVTQATAWNVWNIFNENNYTLEEAVDELVAVELPYFNGYSMGNSKTLNGWSMLMVETQGDNSRALPRGDSVEVAFSDLSASAFSVCNYNMLVLIIDPFNKTKDSNRTNNVFMAPLMAMCDTESGDDSCEVIPDLEEDGRSAMLLSWNYGFPSAYMFTERNGKSGFSPLEYDEMNDKIIESMMTKEHFNRLTALGLCSQGQNEAENAVNESLANGGLQLIKTVRNSLAALTPLGDIATSEHDKVLKMMDLADAVLSQALDRDGPVRFILLKFLAKKIIRNIRGILTMSDSMGRGSDFGDMDGGDFGWMEEEDGMMGPGFGGMGGPHGMGRPARPPGMGGFDFEGTGRPFGMGSDFGGMGRPSGMGNSDFGGMGRPSGMGNSDFGGMGRPSGMGNPDFGGMGRPSGMGNSGFEGMGRPSGMGNPDFEGMGRPSGMGNPDFEGMGRPSGMGNSGFEGMGRPSGMGNSGFEGMGRPSGMGNSDFEGMGRPSGMGRPESSGTRPNQEDNPRQPDMPRPTTGTEEFGGFDSLGPEEADSDCDTVYCFAYGSNICLPDSWLCDGTNDCSNGADEEDCTEIGTPFGTDALHKGPQNIHAEKLQSVVSTLLRGNRENSFRGIPGFFGGENSDGFPRGPPRFPPFRGGMPDFSNLNGSLLNQIFNLTSLNTTFNASALAALFNNTFNMTKHPHGHGPFGKHPLFNGAFNASAFAALFNGTVNASDLAALLNSSFNASAFATLFNTTNFGGFGGGFGHHDFSSAGFPPFGPGPRRRPRTRGSRRQSSRDSGSGFGGPWRQPREPMRMYSENVNRRRGSNSHGEMNKGSGGRKSLLKQMMKKIIMRLATGTSAEDLDELSFFDLPTRQLVKDVYDILTTDGCPKVFLPYKMVARNGEMEPMHLFLKERDMQYMNPSEITQEFLESFMDFMKTNVSETAREMAQGNQTFIELIDLSLLYFDVIKSHAGGITRQIQAIIQDMMLDPHETFILMNMPGPEPTEDMYCMKQAQEEMALKNPEDSSEDEIKFFRNPLEEMLAAVKEKKAKPCFWIIEDGAIFRGERSELSGTMFWEKKAVCSCNRQRWTYNGGSMGHGHSHMHYDEEDNEDDLWDLSGNALDEDEVPRRGRNAGGRNGARSGGRKGGRNGGRKGGKSGGGRKGSEFGGANRGMFEGSGEEMFVDGFGGIFGGGDEEMFGSGNGEMFRGGFETGDGGNIAGIFAGGNEGLFGSGNGDIYGSGFGTGNGGSFAGSFAGGNGGAFGGGFSGGDGGSFAGAFAGGNRGRFGGGVSMGNGGGFAGASAGGNRRSFGGRNGGTFEGGVSRGNRGRFAGASAGGNRRFGGRNGGMFEGGVSRGNGGSFAGSSARGNRRRNGGDRSSDGRNYNEWSNQDSGSGDGSSNYFDWFNEDDRDEWESEEDNGYDGENDYDDYSDDNGNDEMRPKDNSDDRIRFPRTKRSYTTRQMRKLTPNIELLKSNIKNSEGMVTVEGQVVVKLHAYEQTSICDDGEWGKEDAKVICTSLLKQHLEGHTLTSASPISMPHSAEGPPARMSGLKCTGNEDNVLQCKYTWDRKCKVKELAGVICVLK